MVDAEASQLSAKYDALLAEHHICRQKLESKCEALLILSRELAECRSERDQFKLMAEQLRERYQVLKRQLAGHRPMSPSHDSSSNVDLKQYASTQGQGLAQVLVEFREQNKSLQFEVDDLKQKLQDAQGDIKLLREQIVRSRVGTTDEGINTRHFPAYERENLVKQLEASTEKMVQMERDLQQVLDEKQELVTERDAYRHKCQRLNTELNYILQGKEKGVVDIDALINENKFLRERFKQMEEEKRMAAETASKYKSILEKKQNKSILKIGQSRSGTMVMTQKQVQQLIQNQTSVAPTPRAIADLQALCSALLDSVNDKSLALSHQRKTNKILGNRVSELEKKLKTLEIADFWNASDNMANLERLRQECSEVKKLVPAHQSGSSDTSEHPQDTVSDPDSDILSQTPSAGTSPAHRLYSDGDSLPIETDLDLLPTKEEVVKQIRENAGVLLAPKRLAMNGKEGKEFAQDNDENDDEALESEHLLVNGNPEDEETTVCLQNFMDSLTTKLLERTQCNRAVSLPEYSVHTKNDEDREAKASMGGDSRSSVKQNDLVASSSKQSLLREMSEPAQQRSDDQKYVDC